VAQPSGYGVPATANHNFAAAPAAGFSPLAHLTCPNCGFQGEGVSYFSRGGPVLGALLLAALTIFPFMGVGGLIFYLMRYNHRVCPRCGENWGKHGERVRLMAGPRPATHVPAAPIPTEAEMSEDARGLRWGAYLLFAFAAMLTMIAFGEEAFEPLVFGAISAAGGVALWRSANNAREERRARLLVALQQPVLRLAAQRSGVLTVTDVAAALNWPMPRAEKVLNSLEDGLRVASTVTDEGVIVYEFRELMHAPRMSAAEVDRALHAPAPQPQPAALPFPQDGTLSA
jgi:predicted RNA-binding Zn-ribbon protein involved in translation (DUF1610 family)